MAKNNRIALIGLDGSGKSANIKEMASNIEFADYNFMWVRWKPKMLEPAYWLLRQKVKKSERAEKKKELQHAAQKTYVAPKKLNAEYKQKLALKGKIFNNSIIRGAWMFLALIDYLLQFYCKTFRLLIKREKIIFDRFYLDLFVDQGINFGYTPEKIDREIKKYHWLFPKMDKTIYLRVSPETCFRRKDDIPDMDYLLKRYNIYEYLSQNTGWVSIDGELPFDTVNKNIKREILR